MNHAVCMDGDGGLRSDSSTGIAGSSAGMDLGQRYFLHWRGALHVCVFVCVLEKPLSPNPSRKGDKELACFALKRSLQLHWLLSVAVGVLLSLPDKHRKEMDACILFHA